MKVGTLVGGIAALSLAFGAGTLAQTPATQARHTQSDRSSKQMTTLTGCLQGEGSTTGTSGTTGTSQPRARSNQFILANAKTGAGESSSTATPSGTATTGSSSSSLSSSGTSYILEGETKELKDHVGHEIQVTGHLDNGGAPSSKSGSAGMRKMHVNSVRMIAESCSSK